MNEEWWERPTCVACDYWWLLLPGLLLIPVLLFTRDYWLPIIQPPTPTSTPAPTLTPTQTPTPTPTATATPTAAPSPTATPGLTDVIVDQRNVTLFLRDWIEVDGDRVTVEVNGVAVRPDLLLAGAIESIPVALQSGRNTITITALNIGEKSPNTVELTISNVTSGRRRQISGELEEGQSDALVITAP